MIKELEAPTIVDARAVGNTTRLIDWYIQKLFIEGEITVTDHYPHDRADKNTFSRVIRRLISEHNLEGRQASFVIDYNKRKIHYIRYTDERK